MGEIKSTLEIIMEKAEGITVTDEEREGFQGGEYILTQPLLIDKEAINDTGT